MTLSDDTIAHILEFYHKPAYRQITDYEKVVQLGTPITVDGEQCMQYPCPAQTITINSEGYAVTTGKQRVSEEQNAYWYNWYNDDTSDDMSYEYVGPYQWLKTRVYGEEE
jgi:hypothetical protein